MWVYLLRCPYAGGYSAACGVWIPFARSRAADIRWSQFIERSRVMYLCQRFDLPAGPKMSLSISLLCSCSVLALSLFRSCSARSPSLLYSCIVIALFLLCSCFLLVLFLCSSCSVISLLLLLSRFALPLFLFSPWCFLRCSRSVLHLFLLCACSVLAMFLLCACVVLALGLSCVRFVCCLVPAQLVRERAMFRLALAAKETRQRCSSAPRVGRGRPAETRIKHNLPQS